MVDAQIRALLQLAGVPPSNKKAATWLSNAIKGARPYKDKTAEKRPLPADHNVLLADIEKSAKKLIKSLERLRKNRFSQTAFWHSRIFEPVYNDRVEVREVLSAIEKIIIAAGSAKDLRFGRPRETGKQHVVDLAFGFFVRFSPHEPSGTRTGAFATFAREFYAVATESDPERGLDRQIRQALTRLPIERQRARRNSAKKP